MNSLFNKISTLFLASVFVVVGMFCCCLSQSAQAETVQVASQPFCHAAPGDQNTTSSKSHDPSDCHCRTAFSNVDQSFNAITIFAQLSQQFTTAVDALRLVSSSQKSFLFSSFEGPPIVNSLPIYLEISNLRL